MTYPLYNLDGSEKIGTIDDNARVRDAHGRFTQARDPGEDIDPEVEREYRYALLSACQRAAESRYAQARRLPRLPH